MPQERTAPVDVVTRLDPALRYLAPFRTDISTRALTALRPALNERRRAAADALDTSDLQIVDATVPADPPVPVRIYRGGPAPAPAVIHCHSGAFVLGNLDIDHRQCVEFARRAECTVISVDYRLAPEHPFPAAWNDVSSVLAWVYATAAELRIDPARIALSGNSAGGSLAALLAQASQRGTAPPVVFQMLHQPVLDDRPTGSKDEFATTPGFDGPAATLMWEHYFAGGPSAAAVPSRSDGLSELPAALITCSELDPLRDEALTYAQRLMSAGVACELHVFPGTCHGFDSMEPDWDTSQLLFELQGSALRRALHPR